MKTKDEARKIISELEGDIKYWRGYVDGISFSEIKAKEKDTGDKDKVYSPYGYKCNRCGTSGDWESWSSKLKETEGTHQCDACYNQGYKNTLVKI